MRTPRLRPSRCMRYRDIGKRLYDQQLLNGKFAVYAGYGRVLQQSCLVRRHLGDHVGRFKQRLSDLQYAAEA